MFTDEEIHLLEMYDPSSVLEFGIGTGRFAREYLARNKNVHYVGIDNSRKMLSYAQGSGAMLILANFEDYLEEAIEGKQKFDCIIAPYTALHHIQTDEQLKLLQCMKKVANVIILNCLSLQEERVLFKGNKETEIVFALPDKTSVTTTIYTIHETIRNTATIMNEGTERVYLVFSK